MRSPRVVGWGLLLAACSGGYPLPPTRCDEWCDATKGGQCPKGYDPAGCVSTCEKTGLSRPECATAVESMIACYRKNPQAVELNCSYSEQSVCRAEAYAVAMCAVAGTPYERQSSE